MWDFADSMERAPFRINDADVEPISEEPRFRAITMWYLSDPWPLCWIIRIGFVIRPKMHCLFDPPAPTIYGPPDTNPADRPNPAHPGEPDAPPAGALNDKYVFYQSHLLFNSIAKWKKSKPSLGVGLSRGAP